MYVGIRVCIRPSVGVFALSLTIICKRSVDYTLYRVSIMAAASAVDLGLTVISQPTGQHRALPA